MKHLNSRNIEGFDKTAKCLASIEGIRSEVVNRHMDNGQIIHDNRILTQNVCCNQANPQPQLSAQKHQDWVSNFHFPIFLPWFSRQDQSDKVKYVSQTSHLRCPAPWLQLLHAEYLPPKHT